MRTTHTYKPKYSHSTSRTIAQKKKDSRVMGSRRRLDAEDREWNAEEAVGEWGSRMANVMHSLETGQYVPDTGWYEKGLQAKLSFGQPVEKNQEGANRGGYQVVQPKRIMVQRTAQPLTGDSVTSGESMRESRSMTENNTGLPDRIKTGIESLSGYSMDDVRVHYNSAKPAQLQAHAYAKGTEIHVGPGQEKHLPHEAWHVVQQKQGRVNDTSKTDLHRRYYDSGLEQEADRMGEKAMQINIGVNSKNLRTRGNINNNAIQMAPINSVKTTEANLHKLMYEMRYKDNRYQVKDLENNYAINKKHPKETGSISNLGSHAEQKVIIKSLLKYPEEDMSIVTEREPCLYCNEMLQMANDQGKIYSINHFVLHDQKAPENLYKIYEGYYDQQNKSGKSSYVPKKLNNKRKREDFEGVD
ncbi:DUF4157 domain-containing protein [Moorena producens]|nr:DUF4157 domain-containing protein [Moorena producens]